MPGSSLRLTTGHLFYATVLFAVSLSFLGVWGGLVACCVLFVWTQILCGAAREAATFRSHDTARHLPSQRDGFAKPEAVVLILAFALVLAISLPPAQKYDPMRQAEMAMNQVGEAVQKYVEACGGMPTAKDDTDCEVSWQVAVLPQLKHPLTYSSYNFSKPWSAAENCAVLRSRPWCYQVFHRLDEATISSLFLDQAKNGLAIFEHNDFSREWTSPEASYGQANQLPFLSREPQLGEGFWDSGFWVSTHRGNLAWVDGRLVRWFPGEDSRATYEAIREKVDLAGAAEGEVLVVGEPTRVYHVGRLLHLIIFVVVALYPIRWLRQIRDS